eukprot:7386965-Prymnesium_polylepis.1
MTASAKSSPFCSLRAYPRATTGAGVYIRRTGQPRAAAGVACGRRASVALWRAGDLVQPGARHGAAILWPQ